MKGHWYCSKCEDVVFKPAPVGRWDFKHGLTCPVCHHDTADWISDAENKLTSERAASLFAQLKEAVK